MDERWLAHLGSDVDGIASLVILIVVPGVFITAEIVARRRDREREQSAPSEPAGDDPPAP